jgi:hypothetical protein
MATVTLVLGEATFTADSEAIGRACAMFAAGGSPSRYRVQSQVPVGLFRSFLEAVKGKDIEITSENFSGLSHLCAVFGFWSLSSKLSAFRDSPSFKDSADEEARSRISALEERDSQQERLPAAVEAKLSQVAQLPAELARIEAAQRQLSREVEAMREEAKADVAALRSEVSHLKKAADAAERLAQEAQKQLAAEVKQLKASSDEVKEKETEQE